MKITYSKLLFWIITSLMIHSIQSQNDIDAKIITTSTDNLLNIVGLAQNKDATYKDDYSYLLYSLKKGVQGNYSKNSQSGKFSLEPNEQKELATLRLNIQEGEECKVYLFIRKDEVLISKDSTLIYAAEKIEEEIIVDESDLEIHGLVIDDVKTKLGKDFYEYFYQYYLTSGMKYPFIVNITEQPGFGISGKISVNVDDRVIFEFMTRPNDEYIQYAAIEALRYLYNYSTQRRLLYKNKKI